MPRRPAASHDPLHPRRVRAARAALLDDHARALLAQVRPALCEPTRTQIVRALSTGPLTVGDLGLASGRGQTTVSRHLRVLRDDGLVVRRRRGRRIYYDLSREPATRGPPITGSGHRVRGMNPTGV